jgi:uncharacterized protein YpmS
VNNKRFFLAFIALAIATLACSIFIGGPAYPDAPIPVSTSASQDLQVYVQQAVADGAQTGIITLQITESQLTSYLAFKLDSQTDPLITEPQVLLREGQMKVYGKVQSGIFTANISITTRVSVDKNGQPQIEITQTDLGPLPAPQGLNEAVSTFVREAFTGSLGPVATGFRLDSISIADGVMTVTGRVK